MLIGLLAPARAQAPAERVPVCLACHGETGTSELDGVPSLGAQMSDYLIVQLYLFRIKQRVGEPMNTMVEGMTDDELQTLADLLTKLPAPTPTPAKMDAAVIEHGGDLISRYRCNSCHGADLAGSGQIPRIAGQREDYLIKALEEYKSNARPGYNPAMNEAAQELKDADIPIISKFLAQRH
ncbi:MAG: c-type cytochrome [Acetobacteraceae bacterium]